MWITYKNFLENFLRDGDFWRWEIFFIKIFWGGGNFFGIFESVNPPIKTPSLVLEEKISCRQLYIMKFFGVDIYFPHNSLIMQFLSENYSCFIKTRVYYE